MACPKEKMEHVSMSSLVLVGREVVRLREFPSVQSTVAFRTATSLACPRGSVGGRRRDRSAVLRSRPALLRSPGTAILSPDQLKLSELSLNVSRHSAQCCLESHLITQWAKPTKARRDNNSCDIMEFILFNNESMSLGFCSFFWIEMYWVKKCYSKILLLCIY